MSRFFTADLHLGHARICELAERPFASVAEHDEELIRRWNETVSWDDTVWILGDLFLGSWPRGLENAARLHGVKNLIEGNHDRMFGGAASNPKVLRWVNRYDAAGINIWGPGPRLTDIDEWPVMLSHFPYAGDSHNDDRFVESRPHDLGYPLLHGHVHNAWRINGRQVNVGVDVWDYRPVAEGELIPLLADASPPPRGPTGGRF